MPRRLSTTALLLVIATPVFAQEWVEFVDRIERFHLNFPGQPEVKDSTYVGADGTVLPARVYTVLKGPQRYSMTVVNYTGADVSMVQGSIAFAAWNFRKRGGEITYDAFAQVDRIDGHQLQITNADKSRTFVAIHLHQRRLYIMDATVPPGAPPPLQFQQSLEIIDENGERIRYGLDDDGNRTGRVR